MPFVYLDASAGVKLVMDEPESDALRGWLLERDAWTSSALFRTEVIRAARRADKERLKQAREVVNATILLEIDDTLLMAAADLGPPILRALDAVHLATALRLADELEALVTYDRRMLEGARLLGLPVASPA